jgi:hypothetical protein
MLYVTTMYRKVQLPGFCTQRFSTSTKRKAQEKSITEDYIKLDVNNKINNPNRGVKSKIYTVFIYARST